MDVPHVSGSDGLASHAATMKNKGRTIGEASPSFQSVGGAPLVGKGLSRREAVDFPTSCVDDNFGRIMVLVFLKS